jgi:hypothetical protein
MSTAEILAEIPKLSSEDRRRLLDRILEIEDEAASLEAMRRIADETFQMLDAMEAEDAARQSRCGMDHRPRIGCESPSKAPQEFSRSHDPRSAELPKPQQVAVIICL